MSQRKTITKLISSKMKARTDRIAKANGDSEEIGAVFGDYDLYFSGALDLAKAIGLEDIGIIELAAEVNQADLRLAEALADEEDGEE